MLVDDGYTGTNFNRPAIKEGLELVKQGEVGCWIVKDMFCLGRKYIETGRYLRRIFPTYGVRFIAINDGIDTVHENGGDALAASVKNIINENFT